MPSQNLAEKTLLIVDDDAPLRQRLAQAMGRKGFVVTMAASVAEAVACATAAPPAFAVVDLRLQDGYGLVVVETLHRLRPETRIIVLTAYGNIASAVKGIKLGAVDYLAKPADAEAIAAALLPATAATMPDNAAGEPRVVSADRVRWEHIQRVFVACDHNVSQTARCLNMHRRTLQRILNKHAPQEHGAGEPGSDGLE